MDHRCTLLIPSDVESVEDDTGYYGRVERRRFNASRMDGVSRIKVVVHETAIF